MSAIDAPSRKSGDGKKGRAGPPTKKKMKFRTPQYHSSSSSSDDADTAQVDSPQQPSVTRVQPTQDTVDLPAAQGSGQDEANISVSDISDASDPSNSNSDSDMGAAPHTSRKRKRNDPEAFATSMSKILGTKLSTSKRTDPLLARSKIAAEAGHELAEARLEVKARQKLREEKKASLDRGRVKDVLGVAGEEGEATAKETLETEKRLKKTAQRGVVKLFNAVRAAQVRGEQAALEARKHGIVGAGRREQKVTEMSKRGFLELIASGGTEARASEMEHE
ncbi:MAG: hypothetical protein M1833_001881 [Piccolia ochrophora]|nr:MAG: hypothetical protein M1833_001881 [Piccolia ochrophora]